MLGWDEKAIVKIEKLHETEGLRDGDAGLVASMWGWYQDPQHHFYTKEQRSLIKKVYCRYYDSAGNRVVPSKATWDATDRRVFDELSRLLDDNLVPKREVEFANVMRDWGLTTDSDHITGGRFEIMKRIIKSAKNVGLQKKLYVDLKEKFEIGNILSGSPEFSEKMLSDFERLGSWTETQQETIEKILDDNLDPRDLKAARLPGIKEKE